ncbi:MAG TPA: carboxypeptidase regulatory-like domain-containing protein, partial [Gemmatimonadales bacterium]
MIALALAVLGIPAAAQTGVITGHVTDVATKQAISLAQVTVVGTTLRAITSQSGEYRIANVAPGTVQVQTKYIGYKTLTQSVQVAAGGTATLDFAITAAA